MMRSNEERTRKNHKMNCPAVILCLLIVVISLSVNGCGGTFRKFPNQGEVGGTWDLSLTRSNVSVRETKLFITQEERYDPFTGTTSDNATLTGTVTGDNISITLNNADGSTTTLTGTVIDGWKEFSGEYTSTGSDGSGTWKATKSTPAPSAVAVTPSSATLSCSAGQSATFTVTGGTRSSYSVTTSSNGSLINLSTDTLKANGQFTVTAVTNCAGTDGATVSLTVTDTATTVTVPVTISNP